MTEHTSKKFDAELEGIRTRVLQMGGMVELQIVKAMEGLGGGDLLLIDQVIENDNRVNLLEIELDEACNQVIAKRQPTAVDLRMVSTVQKTITDLERIGDEAKKIAKTAKQLHTATSPFMPQIRLSHIADAVVDMLRTALDAYARLDDLRQPTVVAEPDAADPSSDAAPFPLAAAAEALEVHRDAYGRGPHDGFAFRLEEKDAL